MSNGEGGFAKNKPYFANEVHLEVLNQANTQTAEGRQRAVQRLSRTGELLGAAAHRRFRVVPGAAGHVADLGQSRTLGASSPCNEHGGGADEHHGESEDAETHRLRPRP